MQSSTIVNKSLHTAQHADVDFALSPTNLTAILLALLLHERGYLVTLHRPAAQQDDIVLLSQSGLICTELIRRFGIDTARALAAAHLAAMRQYRRLASLYDIEYSQCPIFVRSQDSSLLINETAAASRLGIPATFTGDAMRLDGQLCIKYAQMKAPVRKRIAIHDAPPVTISTGDTGTSGDTVGKSGAKRVISLAEKEVAPVPFSSTPQGIVLDADTPSLAAWDMTMSMAAASAIADEVQGRRNPHRGIIDILPDISPLPREMN